MSLMDIGRVKTLWHAVACGVAGMAALDEELDNSHS
jgi:hypothetical protein